MIEYDDQGRIKSLTPGYVGDDARILWTLHESQSPFKRIIGTCKHLRSKASSGELQLRLDALVSSGIVTMHTETRIDGNFVSYSSNLKRS